MLAIISHSENFDSQTTFQMILENGTKAIATWSRRLQLAQLKMSIKYQCCSGSLQSSHQKNIRFDCKCQQIDDNFNISEVSTNRGAIGFKFL